MEHQQGAASRLSVNGACDCCIALTEKIAMIEQENAQLRQQLQKLEQQQQQQQQQLTHTHKTSTNELNVNDTATTNIYSPLTRWELQRYGRQMLVGEFGVQSQQKLRNARVLIIGIGGLGCPVALYLAAMGVGTLGLVDGDSVDHSNLHRQVLYDENDLHVQKVAAARKKLTALNPALVCECFSTRLTAHNALTLIQQFDVVVDASDNIETRYLVNDACALANKPQISGSALGLEGQVTVFTYDDVKSTPCYRCLYPIPPRKPMTCDNNGVIGAVPGVIGVVQAMETVKVITGMGQPLVGVQCLYDAYDGQFRRVKIGAHQKKPDCISCGLSKQTTSPLRMGYTNLAVACCGSENHNELLPDNRISVEAFARVRQETAANTDSHAYVLLDTRSKTEFEMVHFREAIHFPFDRLLKQDPQTFISDVLRVDNSKNNHQALQTFVICRRGIDSIVATRWLIDKCGLKAVQNVDGGYTEYAREGGVDPFFPMY